MGLSLEYITPGCVLAVTQTLTTHTVSYLMALACTTVLLTCAMPCVPLHSTVINLKSRGYPELSGLSLEYITPGCVPAMSAMPGVRTVSILLAAAVTTILTTAIPCVPRFTCLRKNLLQTIPEFGSFKNDRTD